MYSKVTRTTRNHVGIMTTLNFLHQFQTLIMNQYIERICWRKLRKNVYFLAIKMKWKSLFVATKRKGCKLLSRYSIFFFFVLINCFSERASLLILNMHTINMVFISKLLRSPNPRICLTIPHSYYVSGTLLYCITLVIQLIKTYHISVNTYVESIIV